ncbi:hypothetical protein L2E82_45926 [Cichorium intybus]|uniref:Uncharacterized protein n=1 Tax=Cichorium intybus TaxID=13427 RepID=A0ACB8ZYQ6_CICIN|nr:hypothetical protein L2E82_45926 [Cichorium intybus]
MIAEQAAAARRLGKQQRREEENGVHQPTIGHLKRSRARARARAAIGDRPPEEKDSMAYYTFLVSDNILVSLAVIVFKTNVKTSIDPQSQTYSPTTTSGTDEFLVGSGLISSAVFLLSSLALAFLLRWFSVRIKSLDLLEIQ